MLIEPSLIAVSMMIGTSACVFTGELTQALRQHQVQHQVIVAIGEGAEPGHRAPR